MNVKDKIYRLLLCIICSSFVSLGISRMLLLSYGVPATIKDTILAVLIFTVITSVIFYNLISGAVFFGLLIIMGIIIRIRLDIYIERILYINDRLYSARMFLMGNELPPGYELSHILVLICFIVSVPVSILMCRMRGGAILIVAVLSLYITMWLFGHMYIIPYICLSMCGLIPVLAYEAARHNKKHDKDCNVSPGLLALFMLIPAVIIAALSNAVLPEDVSQLKSKLVTDTLNSINGALSPITEFGQIYDDYNISEMGFNTNKSLLGGPVHISNREILRISGDRPLLLRGAVYNEYTGTGWEKGYTDETYGFEDAKHERLREDIFDRYRPDFGKTLGPHFITGSGQAASLLKELSYEITVLSPTGRTVFSAGRVRDVSYIGHPGRKTTAVYFDMSGILLSGERVKTNDKYMIISEELNAGSDDFDIAISYMETFSGLLGEDSFIPDVEYLALPGTVPDMVYELAGDITRETNSDYFKAKAIASYLRDNFSYTLNPGYPDRDIDFVQHFLDTGEGYCVYFATAMTVMARAAGLPARYVEGFSLGGAEADENGEYIVRARNAHAWSEIFVSGIGWMPFDATPADSRTGTGGMAEEERPSPGPSAALPEESVVPSENPASLEDNEEYSEKNPKIFYLIFVIAIPLALLIAVTSFVYLGKRRYSPVTAARLMPEPCARIEYYWRDILNTLNKMGISPAPGQTPREFAGEALKNNDIPDFAEAFKIAEDCIYGGKHSEEMALKMAHIAKKLNESYHAAHGAKAKIFNFLKR